MFNIRRIQIDGNHYININDFKEIIESCMKSAGAGYLSTQYILRNLLHVLEDAKMPIICSDCGEESYIAFTVLINDDKDIKLVCDICYDKKYRKDEDFEDKKHK